MSSDNDIQLWAVSQGFFKDKRDLVLSLIEKGEFSWTSGLLIAVAENDREFVLLTLIKGANIDMFKLTFSNSEIYYLIQKGIPLGSYNQTYQTVIKDFYEYQNYFPIILDSILIRDLIFEILLY